MDYLKANYVGRKIQLYPGDTYSKFGTIVALDDLGWTIKITRASERQNTFVPGLEYFISHAKGVTFKFVE